MLTLHRRLIALRRAEAALSVGGYEPIRSAGDVLAYRRIEGERAFAIALNLGDEPAEVAIPGRGRIVLATGLDREDEQMSETVSLRADEGVVIELERVAQGEL
jgi:alpha-glucosidase